MLNPVPDPGRLPVPPAAGVRALVYGSLLGALGLAAGASYAARAAGIRSGEDLGERMRKGLAPLSVTLRGWVLPLKERAQAWLGPAQDAAPAAHSAGAVGGEGVGADGEASMLAEGSSGGGDMPRGLAAQFSHKLQEKLNTRRGGGGAANP